jgi:MoaA/NifB/PqqE/SkfB family radical SAM enzyme
MIEDFICLRPWYMLDFYIYFSNLKVVMPCGHSWHSKKINLPNIKDKKSIYDIWNGPVLQYWRRSILDKSYEFCNKERCPVYMSKFVLINDDILIDDIKNKRTILDHGPLMLGYSADKSCNLKCKTCRNNYITDQENFGFNIFLECIKNKDVKKITMSTSGEVFYNKTTLEFLRNFKCSEYPNIKDISIVTNGTLLNEQMWDSLNESKNLIKKISVSVDACTKEIYSKIRGFDFDILLENLKFVSYLKKNNLINTFRLNFVAQSLNIHELNRFCLWAKNLGCNMIKIDKVNDWHQLSKNEWLSLQIDENFEIYKNQIDLLKLFVAENKNIKVVTNLI